MNTKYCNISYLLSTLFHIYYYSHSSWVIYFTLYHPSLRPLLLTVVIFVSAKLLLKFCNLTTESPGGVRKIDVSTFYKSWILHLSTSEQLNIWQEIYIHLLEEYCFFYIILINHLTEKTMKAKACWVVQMEMFGFAQWCHYMVNVSSMSQWWTSQAPVLSEWQTPLCVMSH